MKKIIHAIKYHNRKDLVSSLIPNIPHLQEIGSNKNTTLLVPVPMHPLRKLLRGNDHAFTIAQEISKITEIPVKKILKRSRYPLQQVTHSSRNERLQSQQYSMELQQKIPSHINKIIIVDDVLTTGATLEEAKRALRLHYSLEIKAITLAH